MKWRTIIIVGAMAFGFWGLMGGCNNTKHKVAGQPEKDLWGNDPVGGEVVYQCDIGKDNDEFTEMTMRSTDGSCAVRIDHKTSVMSDHYRLYSPKGNLRIIASGGSEAGEISGYRIDYRNDGKVAAITRIGTLDDGSYQQLQNNDSCVGILKKWLMDSGGYEKTYSINRDTAGHVISIGGITVPEGYHADYYVKESGPFWTSCLNGGKMSFFVKLNNPRGTMERMWELP